MHKEKDVHIENVPENFLKVKTAFCMMFLKLNHYSHVTLKRIK